MLELHGPAGFTTIINDNWRDSQAAEITATGLAPTSDLESGILVTLPPGNYIAVVRGLNNGTGVGVAEVFDLDPSTGSRLTNLSSRAFAATGSDLMLGGFTINGSQPRQTIMRGLGPSLTQVGIPNALADPVLELHNSSGAIVIANNNWQDDPAQAAIITAAGLAPTENLEAAMAATLPSGAYTLLLSGVNNGTGLAVLEVYDTTQAPPVIASPLFATTTVGLPFVYQFVASGATAMDVASLPQGLTFNSLVGAIVGNPTTQGTFPVRLIASNSGGTTTATLNLTVQPAPTAGPVIISSTAATGRVGQPFNFRVYTTGGTAAATVEHG